ncbi:MAG: hypothetical protein IT214_00415 [Chitinophagaceae bacterium]|nr:hypothetical protein [Chitinophagaceae bacterium]
MANYLLLRNNKESGPYSLNDLLNLNLKAYDLVWIEGKSAAWRYPSEVEELKPFAPVVEEQPYDRFFKKSVENKELEIPAKENQKIVTPNTVFVTMPGPKKEVNEESKPAANQQDNSYQRVRTITVTENPVAAEIKYSQPLDEIKEMYVQTLQHRKQRIARKGVFLKSLKYAAVFVYLCALGALIVLTLKPASSNKNRTAGIIQKAKDPVPVHEQSQTQSPQAINNQEPAGQQSSASLTGENRREAEKKPSQAFSRESSSNAISDPGKTEKTNTEKNDAVDQNPQSVNINAVTGERSRTSRNSNGANTASQKENISNLVSVKSNDYKRGVFGGIHDLQLTVSNNSNYVLDNVIVALQYLKPSEQPLKTENISFRSIAPKGSLTIAIPSSKRGIKISYQIVKIETGELTD